jgi:hypothetical protein
MIGAERLLADCQRALDQRLGVDGTSFDFIDLAEIVEQRRYRGMIRARCLLVDRQRLPENGSAWRPCLSYKCREGLPDIGIEP